MTRASRFISKPTSKDFSSAPRMFPYTKDGIKSAVAELSKLKLSFNAAALKNIATKSIALKSNGEVLGTLRLVKDGSDQHLVIALN